MKQFLVGVFLAVCLVMPIGANAATYDERVSYLHELYELLAQLRSMQASLSEGVSDDSTIRAYSSARTSLRQSKYYQGPYEAIYIVEDGTLFPYRNTIRKQEDGALWNLLTRVWGDDAVEDYVREFRLYYDRDGKYDAFVERQGGDYWIVGINLASVATDSSLAQNITTELLVHEYAHVLHYYYPEIGAAFAEKFWNPPSRKTRDYVSNYAMESAEEDFAESFMFFVLDVEPEGSGADEKINFFYDDDTFWDIRGEIRDRLYK